MVQVTIDHLVSLVVLVSALLLSMGLYSQIMGDALRYQRNHQVALKAADLIDSICLSQGYPSEWERSDTTPLAFGLQHSEAEGYSLSPFALQRLLSSTGHAVYYPKAGIWFSNVSMEHGSFLGVPVADCVNYTTVAELLGVNGSYGFQLIITPTLKVSVHQVNVNPLRFRVEVMGPGLVLGNVTLNYYLYQALPSNDTEPLIELLSGAEQTDSLGVAFLEFPSIDGSGLAYSAIVHAHVGGLVGVGYTSYTRIVNNHLIPFVENFEEGTVILAHSWDVQSFGPPVSALHYNATFLRLTDDLKLQRTQIANSTGTVNYGEDKPYAQTQIPPSDTGILLVAYRRGDEDEYGTVMMPWGINTLGVSITLGDAPSERMWVATELRQVVVNEVTYQVKLALWSLES